MKKLFFLFITAVCMANPNQLSAQSALISEKQTSLITYPFSDPDPIPSPGKIYPYARFEGYAANGSEHEWKDGGTGE